MHLSLLQVSCPHISDVIMFTLSWSMSNVRQTGQCTSTRQYYVTLIVPPSGNMPSTVGDKHPLYRTFSEWCETHQHINTVFCCVLKKLDSTRTQTSAPSFRRIYKIFHRPSAFMTFCPPSWFWVKQTTHEWPIVSRDEGLVSTVLADMQL